MGELDTTEVVAPKTPQAWRRAASVHWLLVACALAALFLAAPPWSLWLRGVCVVLVTVLLWAGVRFGEAYFAGQPRGRKHAALSRPPSRRAPNWALALPGICGYLINVGVVVALPQRMSPDDLAAIGVLWFGLVAPLFVTSLMGLFSSLDRPGRFRGLAIVANGTYILTTLVLLYCLLQPRH
jgi:hypothetical protein